MQVVKLGKHSVGEGQFCFVIAEAGVNHNGDVKLAKQLVDAARMANADAVKFQTWITEKIVTPAAPMADYQKQNVGIAESQFEMLKRLELSYAAFQDIKDYADRQEIMFFSTPDEEESADFLDELGVALFKIGSGEVTNLPYLHHVALKNKPVILSTGMATLGEVESAVMAIESTNNRQLVLLHCVSAYPAAPAEANLRAMDTMRLAFGYPVGYSDHTLGIEVAIAAVARGAVVIEKHLTLDRSMAGPDHAASLDPREFAEMVRAIRNIESALGDGIKQPTAEESISKTVLQKFVVTAHPIRAGSVLTEQDLALRRSSFGLGSSSLPLLIGKRAKGEIGANIVVTWDMVE